MLTAEQKEAVRYDDNLMLTACPGSGKTRVIVSKLARVVDSVRETPRFVGCITYTNAAVNEIEARLRRHIQPGDEVYYDVCTIHSFCLNHIFRNFSHLINGYKNGFKVLTPDSDEFRKHVDAVWETFNKTNLSTQDYEEFTQLRINSNGDPVGSVIDQGALTAEIAKQFWKRIRRAGFVDFSNIIYYSLVLLRKKPEILDYVASKFAWILVDEFQDTTDIQIDLLSLIADKGRTKFLLVGDPCQSIFRFAGSRPELAVDFAAHIGARTDLQLSGNFRSSSPILEHAEKIFQRTPPMEALGPSKKFTEEPEWRHGSSALEAIEDYFLPALDGLGIKYGQSAILAPSWFSLFPIGKKLRNYGISVVGPGARPYRKAWLIAPLAEQICGYLMGPNPDIITGIERTLFNTILNTTGRTEFKIFSYQGRVLVFQLIAEAQKLRITHESAVDWLNAAANIFSQVLIDHGYFVASEGYLLSMSVNGMINDMVKNNVDIANLSISDFGVYASPDQALKLSTIHNSKGREFDAVAMIDLHEGKMPSYYDKTAEDVEEKKRLFYVGLTRAKRYLLYVTDRTGRDGPSRFLVKGGLNIEIIQ